MGVAPTPPPLLRRTFCLIFFKANFSSKRFPRGEELTSILWEYFSRNIVENFIIMQTCNIVRRHWKRLLLSVSPFLQNILTVCSCHVTYSLQSESTLYSCLNIKELLARSRREVWSLSDCNWTRTENHLIRKRALNHLAKLAIWLSCVLSTYLYAAFDFMLLSFHVRVSEWIHTV